MSIKVALNHQTVYEYDRHAGLSPQIIRLRPAPHTRTPVLSYTLKISPENHFINWQQDPQSNYLARVVFPEKIRQFRVEVDLVAEMTVVNPFDFFLEPKAEHYPFEYEPWLEKELRPFLEKIDPGPKFADYLESLSRERMQSVDFLVALNSRIQNDISYLIRLEPGVQTCEETLERGNGSCRDSAWFLVQTARHLGLAARFVSGYLIQLVPDVKALDGPAGPSSDFTDLHAWAEVYLPGAGWVGLDPTSGLLAAEGHIPLAATPDPQSAAPITGAVEDCEVQFRHEMSVCRILEEPRVTKPYTEDEWKEIESLGHRIDKEMKSSDIRLTMGGEPTFISIDDMDGDEWNTLAQGPSKRRLAGILFKRLADRFAPGGLLHYGQGKWYPGEPLPRWALTCLWRKDGQPLWKDRTLIAEDGVDYHHNVELAGEFTKRFAKGMGLSPDKAMAAYEDAWYYLWKEDRLPENVDPLDSKLDDEEERMRLARVFSHGLSNVSSYVLPISKGPYGIGPTWLGQGWKLRHGRLHLIPGDSAAGLRLPLESLPFTATREGSSIDPLDPLAPRPPLPDPEPIRRHIAHMESGEGKQEVNEQTLLEPPGEGDGQFGGDGKALPSTAMCVQPRDGALHVFLPPVRKFEDYLELVTAVEATAADLRVPVRIEGYLPPYDPRIEQIKVTPDPGVIEVNVQPAHDWDELVSIVNDLYEDARLSRLGTDKFMVDGRHTGTGGGNHVVVGGASPADSPFLRRPHLLRSVVGYWLNHPSLSYLFSSLFVGPTSQAPRVDEARHDSIYELEIAFRQIPDEGDIPPWLVDRILRNILIDVTGNTHRAEICIDKLYSPDSSTGRLGLVELRGFEMPPHARMSLTQMLLLRALISWFWKSPYKNRLMRWGTQLHDRFMLPHFVRTDFSDVILDLNNAGYPIKEDWFRSHFEFRFPSYGFVTHEGIEIELRQAIEPWHVLGEEGTAGGAVRYVDSSVERLQVKVRNMTGDRHVLACNGRRVPLTSTGVQSEFVAGVRFRAWQPPNCLHPTIPVHAPLVFDLVDSWNHRSIGGCAYHVAHPGGRSYDTFPVNANEAESRRHARFYQFGHTPGPMETPSEERNPDFPFTLDLRR